MLAQFVDSEGGGGIIPVASQVRITVLTSKYETEPSRVFITICIPNPTSTAT